jgi:hypothetical protein
VEGGKMMVTNKAEKFAEFLSESFRDGVSFRELRLSVEEVDFLKRRYPKASVKKSPARHYSEEKSWYEVNLLSALHSVNETDLEAIQRENRKLKQELESLKRSIATV